MAEQNPHFDETSQANAGLAAASAGNMHEAEESLNTRTRTSMQSNQDTPRKRRKLDDEVSAEPVNEIEAAEQALLRQLDEGTTTQPSKLTTTQEPESRQESQAQGAGGDSSDQPDMPSQQPSQLVSKFPDIVQPGVGTAASATVEECGTSSHDDTHQPLPTTEGTTLAIATAEPSDVQIASTQAHAAFDSSSISQAVSGASCPVLKVPRLEGSMPAYPFRPGAGPEHRIYHAQRDAKWSPDGLCIMTTAEDDCLRTHQVLGPPYLFKGVYKAPNSIITFAPMPTSWYEDINSTRVVVSVKELPLTLLDINDQGSGPVANYQLMEEGDDVHHIAPNSVKFMPDGKSFVCGGNNRVAIFDIHRRDPVDDLVTHSRKRKPQRDPTALSGIILDLDLRHDGLLAVGTSTSKLGIYDDRGAGRVHMVADISEWSDRRASDEIIVVDTRYKDVPLAFLSPRPGQTQQKLNFDFAFHPNGYNVIAGGTDGVIRVWENPAHREGIIEPTVDWQAHDDAVANVVMNPVYPQVFVTTAGSRHYPTEDEYNSSDDDGSNEDNDSSVEEAPVPSGWMKLWAFED